MISDSPSSSSSHLIALSRAYRSREWSVRSVQRKRKRTRKRPGAGGPSVPGDQCHPWFEVRPTPSKGGGIGTFSTQHIPSGQILVCNERPIVCIPTISNPNDSSSCCQACMTPLGDLRYQLGGNFAQDNDNLPFLGSVSPAAALKFTEPAKDLFTCDLECGARWCSAACLEPEAGTGRIEHGLLCCGPTGEESINNWKKFEPQRCYRDDVLYNPDGAQPMLLLAGKVLTTVLGAIVRDLEESVTRHTRKIGRRAITEWDEDDLFWWKEFAHPLWWEIGTTALSTSANHKNTTPQDEQQKQIQKERKKLCKTSHALLSEALRSSISRIAKESDWISKKETLVVSVMERLCTVQHLGEILGMLQCNIMEVEFPSPRQQFMTHLDQAIDGSTNSNSNEKKKQATEYKSWRNQYLSNRRADLGFSPTGDDGFDVLEDVHSPITGSGLFPILTLANHDCDPNVSIEFLGESNRGSLVALRDISYGEEICITYIPIGNFDCGDLNGARFRNRTPTRTWLHLNEGRCRKEDLTSHRGEEAGSDKHVSTIDTEDLPDGTLWEERARYLLDYGFDCRCKRCLHEQREDNPPYCR